MNIAARVRTWLDRPLEADACEALDAVEANLGANLNAWISMTLVIGFMGWLLVGWPAVAWAGILAGWLAVMRPIDRLALRVLGLTARTQGALAYEVVVTALYHFAWSAIGLIIWLEAPAATAPIGAVICIAFAVHVTISDRHVPALMAASFCGPMAMTVVMSLEAALMRGDWAWCLATIALLGTLAPALRQQLAMARAQREARAQAEQELALWRLAGEASRGGQWHYDFRDKRVGWSAQLDEVFGVGHEAFMARGGDFAALSPEPWRTEINTAFRAARDRGDRELRLRYPILRPDGTEIWIENSIAFRRDASGAPLQAIGFLQDVTARMAAEHAAQAANEAKTAFLATMSHEIRTPLNGVIGVVGALERTELAPAQREMVELIRTSGETLERILSDILDLSRIESGRHVLESAPFDLAAAAEAIRRLMTLRASEKGLEFLARIDVRGRHIGDETALRQIITNLLSNAMKFTAHGSVRLVVEARDAGDGCDDILIEVADTGIGFDEATGARLFQRFVEADGTIARSYGGSGLGLSICKGLVERMGGTIEASSTPGAGSVFAARLRLERAAADVQDAPGAEGPSGGLGDAGRLRILLAEDNPTNQRVVSLLLEPTGAAIMLAGNGLEALEAWRTATFDLVLMDLMMPEMDGLAATIAIREAERSTGRDRTSVVMLSANAMPDHLRAAAEAGCDGHIAKPLTPQRLFAGIEAAISQSAAASPSRASDAA
jgi:PAS domain S-box-containing protein